ncbi:MAG: efflux RND transporter permease subunit [Clostridiales bacterium]|nr:efflux RND transporter permease subunit [Clostridiales bacterium]
MIAVGKWITKHKALIIAISIFLVIPSLIGMVKTRTNYDLLSYLPDTLETVSGQDIMVDEFGMGAFSMVIVENMEMKDVSALKEEIKKVDHVSDVIWYDSLMDITVPTEMLPADIQEVLFHGDATMLIVLFDDTTSADNSMQAVTDLRKVVGEQCFISGMTGLVTDIKDLALSEIPVYVVIAVVFVFLVLMVTTDSFATPIIFLCGIGFAVLYNMGSNYFLGETSYITTALAAVLQLGVTMDYSIFLLESYRANKERFPGDKNRAMAHAISNTFRSVCGSSLTTVAGFAALCAMTFALGRDLGVVMAKGVIIGVIVCVTLLPCLILVLDGWIEKWAHKEWMPSFHKLSDVIIKYRWIAVVIFAVLMIPAIYGNNHVSIYYNLDKGLPEDIPSTIANQKLEKEFDMSVMHIVMLPSGLDSKVKTQAIQDMEAVDGIKWVVGMNSFLGASIPEDMIPKDLREMLSSDNYELMFICSNYKTASDEVNKQIDELNDIVKKVDSSSMVIGEAPLTKDLMDVTNVDLKNVNIWSIGAIFLIIMITFKSISLPIILVAVIEFAIFVNMSIPYYTNTPLVFVASIVIGAIQLGATVDYAILMTSRYQKERLNGKGKAEAVSIAHKTSIKSIITSGSCLFAACFGITLYSSIDMIKAITTLLARGTVISVFVVLCILPAMLWIFDSVICKTTWDMRHIQAGKKTVEKLQNREG